MKYNAQRSAIYMFCENTKSVGLSTSPQLSMRQICGDFVAAVRSWVRSLDTYCDRARPLLQLVSYL